MPPAPNSSPAPTPPLSGRVVDAAGRPLAGVPVRIYAGLATRWQTGETHTDAAGRFAFDEPNGSRMGGVDGPGATWVGVSVGETVDALNPAAYLPWRDVRIQDGGSETVDFVLDSADVARRIAELRAR